MTTKTEVSPLVGAGTETSGDTEYVPPKIITASPIVEGGTPFQVMPMGQAAVRIMPITYGFLVVTLDSDGGVRVHLSANPTAGGEYEITITGNKHEGLVVEHGVS